VTGGYADAAAYDEKMGWGDGCSHAGEVVERPSLTVLKTPLEFAND
jgi:hypothetical protein